MATLISMPEFNLRNHVPMEHEVITLVHQLSSVRDTQAIMDIVRHGARDLLGADGVTFVLRDNGYCYYAEEDAISPLWKGMRFPMTSCISGWAMLNQKTAIIEDIYLDSRIPHDAYRRTFVRSLVMVPVRREDPMAAIGAYWKDQRQPSEQEVALLETIANAAAVAMTNVGLIYSLHNMVEELQQRNKELDLAYRARANFMANMSHELRTPLNVIIGFAEVIKRQINGTANPEKCQVYAKEIAGEGEKLLHMINDILDLTALGSGSYSMTTEDVSLNDVITSVVSLVEQKLVKGRLTLENSVPENLPTLKGNHRLLKEIFFNIVANSTKFTPPEGKITITAAATESEISCTITDTGIGMSAEQIDKAMRPFEQISEGLDRKFEGAGIGLTLCKGYVDLHGGKLDIQSEPDQGTTITVTLPL